MGMVKTRGLSVVQLQVVALTAMLIDHVGAALFPDVILFRVIGRVAMPLFVMMFVDGMVYTHCPRRYGFRLLIFGLVSGIPFNLLIYRQFGIFYHGNVMLTFFIAWCYIMLIRRFSGFLKYQCIISAGFSLVLQILMQILLGLAGLFVTEGFGMDYADAGFLACVVPFVLKIDRDWLRDQKVDILPNVSDHMMMKVSAFSVFYMLVLHLAHGVRFLMLPVESFAGLALILILAYHGRHGAVPSWFRWFRYGFYPVHMVLLVLIRDFLV